MRALATLRIASAAASGSSPRGSPTPRAIAARAASTSSRPPAMGRSGSIRPSSTWASVTVGSVPPRPWAAGPGSDPALRGPTWRSPPAVHRGDRAAAGADGGDLDHRQADHEAEVDARLRRRRRSASHDQRHVEGGAAHVARHDVREARGLGDAGRGGSPPPPAPRAPCARAAARPRGPASRRRSSPPPGTRRPKPPSLSAPPSRPR